MNEFSELRGNVLTSVVNNDNEELIFTTKDGEVFKLYHDQDCCENVTIEDICGDLEDLIGGPLLEAEEVSNESCVNPDGVPEKEYQDSFTWTFYKLGTRKGSVTVRWYGESNGYYSESVSFIKVEE